MVVVLPLQALPYCIITIWMVGNRAWELTQGERVCSKVQFVQTVIFMCNRAAELFNIVKCNRNLSNGSSVQLLPVVGSPQVWAKSFKMMDRACISHLADVAK